jgi:hypothetical protein
MSNLQPISQHAHPPLVLLFCALALNQRNGGFHDEHNIQNGLSASLFICSLCGFSIERFCVCAASLELEYQGRGARRGVVSFVLPLF